MDSEIFLMWVKSFMNKNNFFLSSQHGGYLISIACTENLCASKMVVWVQSGPQLNAPV